MTSKLKMPWTTYLCITLLTLFLFFGASAGVVKSILLLSFLLITCGLGSRSCFDVNALSIFTACCSYLLLSQVSAQDKLEVNFLLMVMPLAAYGLGRWVGFRCNSTADYINFFLILGVALGGGALGSVLLEIVRGGFSEGARSIQVLGMGDEEISATVLGGTLIILIAMGGLVFASRDEISVAVRFLVGILFLAAILAALRLGSRTLLVNVAVTIIVAGYFSIRRSGRGRRGFFYVLLAVVAAAAFALYFESELDLLAQYQDRVDSDEFGAATAGGRTEKWSKSIELLLSSPLGWSFAEVGYAHNLWLDSARNGGWIALFFLVIATVLAIRSFHRAIACSRSDPIYISLIISFVLSYLIIFSIEPVFDGFIAVFSSFCCFWGVVSAESKVNRVRRFAVRV